MIDKNDTEHDDDDMDMIVDEKPTSSSEEEATATATATGAVVEVMANDDDDDDDDEEEEDEDDASSHNADEEGDNQRNAQQEESQTPSTSTPPPTPTTGAATEGVGVGEDPTTQSAASSSPPRTVPLYKSTRFKGYMTLLLASIIYYDAAQKSNKAYAAATVPATEQQQNFALAVAFISIGLTGAAVAMHLDQFSCLHPWWQRTAFRPGSRIECALSLFLFSWWIAITGWQTSIQGLAGDGRQQYSLYYSAWVCVYASFFQILEPWWVAAGWKSSLSAFVRSWPHRAPGWLCILALALIDLVWLLDLWRNYHALRDRRATQFLYFYLEAIPTGHWRFLVSLTVFTITAAAVWVLIELFRETAADGVPRKPPTEVMLEGLSIMILLALWIPSIMLATTSGGAAALVGNYYFFSWAVVVFLAETAVWYVHDLRERMHQSLVAKENEYRAYQRQVQTTVHQTESRRHRHHRETGPNHHHKDLDRDDVAGRHDHNNNRNSNNSSSNNWVAAPEFLDTLSEF